MGVAVRHELETVECQVTRELRVALRVCEEHRVRHVAEGSATSTARLDVFS